MGTQPPNLLDATQIESQPGAPGRYRANLSDAWDAPIHPSGGVVTAVALRAMQAELGLAHQRLRSFSTVFVSTVESGPLEIAVERLRLGKRMSQLRAEVRSPGRREIGHVTTAAFGETRPGVAFSYSAAPEVGPPGDYPPPAELPPGAPVFRARFFENVETRRVRMFHSFEKDWEGGSAEAIRWFRYRVAPRLPDGRLDPLALIGLADTMPPAVGQYLGPGQWFFHAPSVDLSMHFFAETDGDWLLARSVCHWAGDGYASAEITLWDERRRLLAFATQVMLLRVGDPAELGLP
jgi:acyl-CoA thioesterase